MIFDAFVCVGPQERDIALKSINSLKLFSGCRRITVITNHTNFPFFQQFKHRDNPLRLMDEDHVVPSLTLQVIKDIIHKRTGTEQRAGWYFQQFLKMSISYLPEITDYYLLWDGDTIMLKKMDFFSREKVLVNPKTECHKPYFRTMKKLLGIDRQVNYSFISEHFMIKTPLMRELISELAPRADIKNHLSWITRVLDNIEDGDITGSGFSEYETYGNFIASRYPESFVTRTVKSLRFGSSYYGVKPDKYDLARLIYLGFDLATFETVDCAGRMFIARNKFFSKIHSLYYCLSPNTRQFLHNGDLICNHDSRRTPEDDPVTLRK